MTHEEIIQHVASVVSAVFHAEQKISSVWTERLQAVRQADEDTKYRTYNAYLRAVAEEIISSTPEEELQQLYH